MATSFQDPFSAFLADQTLSIPLGQVLFFTLLMTLCILFGRHKLGLLISYVFVFFWGFIFNRSQFVDLLGNTSSGLYIYGLSGVVMVVLAVTGMLKRA
jgi:hypothetical protein